MSTKASETTTLELVKFASAFAMVVAAVVVFYGFPQVSFLYRVIVLVGAVLLAGAVVYHTEPGHRLWAFGQGSRAEVRRMVWPTRMETVQVALIVFVMVFFVGLMLWAIDSIFSSFLRWFTGARGG